MAVCSLLGATERNLLEKKASLEQVKNALIMDQKWVPFPKTLDGLLCPYLQPIHIAEALF